MDRIMTELTTTISEFKKNPNAAVKKAKKKPFAVLTNNKTHFWYWRVQKSDYLRIFHASLPFIGVGRLSVKREVLRQVGARLRRLRSVIVRATGGGN